MREVMSVDYADIGKDNLGIQWTTKVPINSTT